jgi:hypothetical protein
MGGVIILLMLFLQLRWAATPSCTRAPRPQRCHTCVRADGSIGYGGGINLLISLLLYLAATAPCVHHIVFYKPRLMICWESKPCFLCVHPSSSLQID